MNQPPEHWQRVKALFAELGDIPRAGRGTWLAAHEGPDAAAAREALGLVEALERDPARFEVSAVVAHQRQVQPQPGTRIGPWRVLREIGRGGMGIVFEAERDDEEFRQRAAIKTISAGLRSAEVLQRFRHERQILAQLSHPHIAALLDGGVTADQQPYFAMELVEGVPITEYATQRGLDVRARLRLFLQVCDAVAHAHRALVVHRDLKPSNILVTPDGAVKLLDFGIAKVVGGDLPDTRDELTELGGPTPLTAAYASPEQVRGEPVTVATDVFSLGVVLYQLLAGQHPFNHDHPGADTVRHRIREADPVSPGAVRGAPVQALAPVARGELGAIVHMALHKDRDRRYDSVGALRRDLQRFLDGFPVAARGDSAAYRTRKFVRRHRAAVTGGAGMVVLLVAGMVSTLWQARRAAIERDRAQRAAAHAERVSSFLQATLGAADPSWYTTLRRPASETTLGTLIDDAGRNAETHFAAFPDALADVLRTIGRANQALRRTDRAIAQLERARTLHVATSGSHTLAVATDEHELGMALQVSGDLAGSERWLRHSLATFAAIHDSTSDPYGRTLGDLGITLASLGRPADAEPFIRASARHRRTFDSTSVANAILLGNLGLVLSQQGKLAEAESVYRATLQAFARFPQDFFERGYTLGNLAVDLILRGRAAEALPLAREQVQVFVRQVGEAHAIVGYGHVNVARALHALGREDEALAAARQAEALFRRTVADDHPDIARTEAIIGEIMGAQGQSAEGERRLRHALAIRVAKFAAGSPHIADVEVALGKLLLREGRPAEADTLLRSAAARYQRSIAAEDPRRRQLEAVLARGEGGVPKPS